MEVGEGGGVNGSGGGGTYSSRGARIVAALLEWREVLRL